MYRRYSLHAKTKLIRCGSRFLIRGFFFCGFLLIFLNVERQLQTPILTTPSKKAQPSKPAIWDDEVSKDTGLGDTEPVSTYISSSNVSNFKYPIIVLINYAEWFWQHWKQCHWGWTSEVGEPSLHYTYQTRWSCQGNRAVYYMNSQVAKDPRRVVAHGETQVQMASEANKIHVLAVF